MIVCAAPLFTEFMRQPCVQMPFFDEGKKVVSVWKNDEVMCANPKIANAAEMCCGHNGEDN